MSKAFTKESDDSPDIPLLPPRTPLPPGVKNYITRDGAARFQEEIARLAEERTALVSNSDPAAQSRLARLDQRVRQLQEILQSADVVEPSTTGTDRVRFGLNVTVRDQHREESTYRIVGVDEMDLDRNWISWQSPLARALLNKRVGEEVKFRTPAGEQRLEILGIQSGP